MKPQRPPSALDLQALVRSQAPLHGQDALSNYERLGADRAAACDAAVDWSVAAELRAGPDGATQLWMQVQASTRVPLVCQRCLQPVDWPLAVQGWFRFVASEQQAEQEDDAADEDLLVYQQRFDVRALLEDELILALPLVPKHERCPRLLPAQTQDADFDATDEKPHPFAELAKLRSRL